MNDKHAPFNEIDLARALRASLTNERLRMRELLEDIARVRMQVRDAAAIRADRRAGAHRPEESGFRLGY
jgi:hypothetical protein